MRIEKDQRTSELPIPHPGVEVYNAALLHLSTAGMLIGAGIAGAVAYLISSGMIPLAVIGQLSAAGAGPAVFTAAGTGAAAGALAGGLVWLFRTPPRKKEE